MAPLLHGRRSVAWDHFVKRDEENKLAECLYCNDILCYTSTSANLLKHLKGKHNFQLKNVQEKDDNSTNVKLKLVESDYLEYFLCDEEEKKATCKLCSEEVDYEGSSTAPIDHLKVKHSEEVVITDDDDHTDYESGDDIDAVIEIDGRKRRPSVAWDYFDIHNKGKKLASCKLCGVVRSYRTTVTNLIRHVTRKHHIDFAVESADSDVVKKETEAVTEGTDVVEDSEPQRKPRLRSPIWLYFRPVDLKNRRSECRICKKVLSYATTVSNLKMHLARKHPDSVLSSNGPEAATKRILMTAGGDLYEVAESNGDLDDDDDHDQNDVEEMDTVYLEDFDNLEKNPSKKQKTKKRKENTLPTVNLQDSSSDDDVPIKALQKNNHSTTTDALDHFGKYVASLLRELPKEISNRLQSDFVSQIMDAQLTYESQKLRVETAGDSAYSITVTAVDSQSDVEQNVAAEVVVSQSKSEL